MEDEKPNRNRAILAAVHLQDADDSDFQDALTELGRLARTLGLTVLDTVIQKRPSFHSATYLGTGKVEELKAVVDEHEAGLVLVNNEISPSQARNLEKETGARVMDRTAVILEIFHRHARSKIARAQVEIVRLKYMAPRLREQGDSGDRQQGGIGGKGAGESKMELDHRKIRDRIAELTEEIEHLERDSQTQRARRQQLNRVAFVGYTNAGKSTLMRALTGSDVLVADKLFATLDTTVRALVPESFPRVLISDTVGFIDNLPHGLVASFKSTLDEAHESSLLLHVVDASDRSWRRQYGVTRDVLADIGADVVPRIMIFNKLDAVGDAEAQAQAAASFCAEWPDAIVMSATNPGDVVRLHSAISAFFKRDLVEEELHVPYSRQNLRAVIFAECEVLEEKYDEAGVVFRVRAHPSTLERLRTGAEHVG
ncbi:MAG: GTPase HflX [Deltaproteobacteria bacterium]|nr:GTPase HflX [Deltaproteobacteria bacterium]